jgi:hypothetical protein
MKNHFVLIHGCYAKGNKLLAFEMLFDVVIYEEKWNRVMILIAEAVCLLFEDTRADPLISYC